MRWLSRIRQGASFLVPPVLMLERVRGAVTANANPRKAFDQAVTYAVSLAGSYLRIISDTGMGLSGLRYLELGPGADFAPHLVLVDHGVRVTLADKYLAAWDPKFHPRFYAAFLEQWDGPGDAVRAAIARRGYDGLIELVAEPADRMASVKSASFDFALSNAVLEHVGDIAATARELGRVTRPSGIHSHQIDLRDHRNFDRPLEYLLMRENDFQKLWQARKGSVGTTRRLPEILEAFIPNFWLWQVEHNGFAPAEYVDDLVARLPEESPYRAWPKKMLEIVSARVTLVRKQGA